LQYSASIPLIYLYNSVNISLSRVNISLTDMPRNVNISLTCLKRSIDISPAYLQYSISISLIYLLRSISLSLICLQYSSNISPICLSYSISISLIYEHHVRGYRVMLCEDAWSNLANLRPCEPLANSMRSAADPAALYSLRRPSSIYWERGSF
jgi:hypothetical protein